MRKEALPWLAMLCLTPAMVGCQQGMAWNGGQAQQGQQQIAAQMQVLQQKAAALDTNNRDLHRQLAESRQQAQLLQDRANLLTRQLNDTAEKLASAVQAKQASEKRVETITASTRLRGGATITANNSLNQSLKAIEIPGVQVRVDGDVVRIELPSDKLFVPGTANINPAAVPLIDQVAAAVQGAYPRQVIGIEGHTDSDPPPPQFRSQHQLAISQAQSVLDTLTQRNRFAPQRLFVLGHGANHPQASNGTPEGKARNRRVELVVYPETRD
jgi:chemotaxis protein MotB